MGTFSIHHVKKYLILNTHLEKCFSGILAVMVKFASALRCPFGFCSKCNIYVSIALLCTIVDSRCPLCQCGIAGMVTTAMVNVGVSCNSNMISSFKSHLSFLQLLIVMWVLDGHLVQSPINERRRSGVFYEHWKGFTVDVYIDPFPPLPSYPSRER